MKRFSFVFFIHHHKTVIKADQTSSFYLLSLYQGYIVLKISKVGKCHRDNVISSEATKTYKPKAWISHFKKHFRLVVFSRISGLRTFGRKQRLLRFSTVHFSVYESIYPRLNLESSQTSLCLAVILMYIYSFWDGLYRLNISILDTRLCLTSSTVFQSGKCIIINGLKVDVRWG